jgi:hypothetical protein
MLLIVAPAIAEPRARTAKEPTRPDPGKTPSHRTLANLFPLDLGCVAADAPDRLAVVHIFELLGDEHNRHSRVVHLGKQLDGGVQSHD